QRNAKGGEEREEREGVEGPERERSEIARRRQEVAATSAGRAAFPPTECSTLTPDRANVRDQLRVTRKPFALLAFFAPSRFLRRSASRSSRNATSGAPKKRPRSVGDERRRPPVARADVRDHRRVTRKPFAHFAFF